MKKTNLFCIQYIFRALDELVPYVSKCIGNNKINFYDFILIDKTNKFIIMNILKSH